MLPRSIVREGALVALVLLSVSTGATAQNTELTGFAVLPAATFANGPTSGQQLGAGPFNGVNVPFADAQPVQGFSAVQPLGDGRFLVMSDNGFGSLENSADYELRVYTVAPDFRTTSGGTGDVAVEGFVKLSDPNGLIPFATTNHFTPERVLTGADFDLKSFQIAPDGTWWFGEEFGPFLLHTDANGVLLEAPIPLPDFANGGELRSPQNPFSEEASAVRVMNAMRTHAKINGSNSKPVFSPWHVLLEDNDPSWDAYSRSLPAGSGVSTASSEIFDVGSLQGAGHEVVVYTVNDGQRMTDLLDLGVDGIISDAPDVLLARIAAYDADNDGTPGDYLDANGLIDITKVDAQGHRGARNLRPENTLPSMEAALDSLMTTLETDTGITADGVAVLNHDPYIESSKCRLASGAAYDEADELLVKDLTVAQIQSMFICDVLQRNRPNQTNNVALSPVSLAFAGVNGLMSPYVMPTLAQLFDFVSFYETYYTSGPGSSHPEATLRALNASRVRFNIETKINPRSDTDSKGVVFSARTVSPLQFTIALTSEIASRGLQARADIQSFDFRTLLLVHQVDANIRTVCLFGDFPIFADPSQAGSSDGTNLQPEGTANTPWLAGLFWPYHVTKDDAPFQVRQSGGFEGMALSNDGKKLLPLLEKPLVGAATGELLIHEFDLATKSYTGVQHRYQLEPEGSAIGDFIMYGPGYGLVIERDGSQGDLNGFKAVYQIEMNAPGAQVTKSLAVDLLDIRDPNGLAGPGQPGDIGLGNTFAFPFVTIEDVYFIDHHHIGVINDNNYPFSVGRHVGTGAPDDNEFIVVRIDGGLDPYPGTGDPLVMSSAVNEPAGGSRFVHQARANDFFSVKVDSPTGIFVGTPYYLFFDVFPTGNVPVSVPFLHVDPISTVFLVDASLATLFPQLITPEGISFLTQVPVGLGGFSAMFQAAAMSPLAGNGFIAVTDGHELRILP